MDIRNAKCKECAHFVLSGWFDPPKVCDKWGYVTDPETGACISFKPKDREKDLI